MWSKAHLGTALVGVALVATLAVGLTTLPASAAAPTKTAPPSTEACSAFADYFQVEYLVAIASGFAGLGDKSKAAKTAQQIKDTFHLVLSPKLEQIARTLAKDAGPPLRALFLRQAAVYAHGTKLLQQAGLTAAQIQTLATLDVTPDTDIQKVLAASGNVNLDKKKFTAAVKKFGASSDVIDVEQASRAQQQGFVQTGTSCGVFPVAAVSCDTLVTPAEATALLGGPTKAKNDNGTCTYAGPASSSTGDTKLAVDVYDSAFAYDRVTKSGQNENVPGVGDAAIAIDGFNAFSNVSTCGRSLVTKQGNRTVSVAACTGATPPTDAQLASVATNALARLGPA